MQLNFDEEFLTAYKDFRGSYITEEGLVELTNYYPEKYGRHTVNDFKDPVLSREAGKDFLVIIKSYLRYYRIPMTMESLVAAYEWGIGNLRKNGLYKAPRAVKRLIADMRHTLAPQAIDLDADADK